MASQTLPRELSVRYVGGVVAVVGAAALLCYPLAAPPRGPAGIPQTGAGKPLLASMLLGPPLLVWGTFAFRDRTFRPLTVGRALVVPVLATLAVGLGFARFVVIWERGEPYATGFWDYEADRPVTVELSPLELFEYHLGFGSLVVLAGLSAIVVGTAAARRGRRAALASGIVPIGIASAGLLLHAASVAGQATLAKHTIPIAVSVACASVAVGYFAAAPTGRE